MKKIKSYLKILDIIRDYSGKKPPQKAIADKLGVSTRTVRTRMNVLKKNDVINYLGNGTWEVNEANVRPFIENVHSQKKVNVHEHDNSKYKQDMIRGHGFQFTLKLPKEIPQYTRRKLLDILKIEWKETGSPTWGEKKGEKFEHKGWTVWFTHKSIIAWFSKDRSAYAYSSIDAFMEAMYLFKRDIVWDTERWFGKTWKKKSPFKQAYEIKICKEHYALIKNTDAKNLRDDNKKIYVVDHDGKVWLITDFSHSTDETELVKAGEAQSDERKMSRHYQSVKDTGMSYYDVLDGFKKTQNIIDRFAEQQEEYAKNIQAHIGVMQSLEEGVRRLTDTVKDPVVALIQKINSVNDIIAKKAEIEALPQEKKHQLMEKVHEKLGGI